MSSRIGQQFGNYRLLRFIGYGGFAEVYQGEHIYMGTQAAIKVLHTQLGSKEVEGFRQEASMVARLEHPHIVRVLEFGVQDTTPFLVLSYAPNGTLRERYPKGTVLPLPTIVEYVKQLADVLQYAHDEKIIHRDIKPENILLGKHYEILLSDFGIALISQSSRSLSVKELAGTAAYMAPEQIEAQPRAASDQYALGVITYEWLCGSCPFEGTFTETALKHVMVPPPSLRERMPEILPEVEQVVFTALAKDPTRRFASVRAFAHALEQASQLLVSSSSAIVPPIPAPSLTVTQPARESQWELGDSDEYAALPTMISSHLPAFSPSPAHQPSNPSLVNQPSTPSFVHLSSQSSSSVLTNQPSQPSIVTIPTYPLATPPLAPVGPGSLSPGSVPVASRPMNSGSFPPTQLQHSVSSPRVDVPPPLPKRVPKLLLLLIGVALIVISGGVLGSFYLFHKPPQNQALAALQARQTAIVTMQAKHKLAVSAYNQLISENGGMFGFDTQHTHFNPYETILGPQHIAANQAWVVATSGSIMLSSAVVDDGIVYIGSQDGKLYAFDAISGQQKWVAATGGAIDSSPAAANGIVYVGSEDHKLYAFDMLTGHLKWAVGLGASLDSSPTLAYGVLYIGSHDGMLYAFNAQSGQQEWVAPTDGSAIYASPAVAYGLVYIASLHGKVYAFDLKSGRQMWMALTGGPIYSSPAAANGLVYVGSFDHKLYAFDGQSGKQKWAKKTTGAIFASPAVANGLVYVSVHLGALYAFNAVTGVQQWASPPLDTFESSPFVANGLVYLGADNGAVLVFDTLTGTKKGAISTNAPVYSSPTVANGILYVGAASGRLYAFYFAG